MEQTRFSVSRSQVVAIGVIIAAALLVAACSSAPRPSNTSSGHSRASEGIATPSEASTEEGCTTGPAEYNVRVTIYGAGEAACSRFNQGAAKTSDEFWKTLPSGEEPPGELVCSMASGKLLIEVRDTGEHVRGDRICARLTAQGWHEQEGPGEKVERARKAKEAEEQADAELREAKERGEAERREAAETRQREAHEKVERQREEAKQKQEEAHQQRQQRAEERHSEEEVHQAEEETHRAEHEAESAGAG